MTRIVVPGANASIAAPNVNSTAAQMIVWRRPSRSARFPAIKAPTSAPSVTQLVMISMTRVLGWKLRSIPFRAPPMTPWS